MLLLNNQMAVGARSKIQRVLIIKFSTINTFQHKESGQIGVYLMRQNPGYLEVKKATP